ncbi:hypothetical protein CMI37_18515 [Candidatus Pacearchaeota archaeon]|nr:hypothetical protein [Candidatus Pacearchaeota archaeon]|tara:strand:- start:12953 stop:13987 length:1035 start_codon:yes stop_codon:yes gene_type:complete
MGIKIGVTGEFCSGKDMFAEYLVEKKGFKHISLSDIIRSEAKRRGIEPTRESLQKLGNELREKEGNNVLAKMAIASMNYGDDYVITSIRNPLEIKELVHSGDFILVSIRAPIEVRFKRMTERLREGEHKKTFEEFAESEKKEMKSQSDSGQRVGECIQMAQFEFFNDSSREDFFEKIEDLLPKIRNAASFVRPTWDEYFMNLVRVVGDRGTCSRGRSGCVIVKDKRILTTGYVGSPPGMAHCDEIGHWFKKTIHEDGSVTQHCIRTVHSEANAIAQAAKNGISIGGATLYCNMEPCLDCTKLLISAGIKRIVCAKKYHAAQESREMLEEVGVKLVVLDDEVEKY